MQNNSRSIFMHSMIISVTKHTTVTAQQQNNNKFMYMYTRFYLHVYKFCLL